MDRVYELFPRLEERRKQDGRLPVRRRAADAGDRPGADADPKVLLLDEPTLGLAPLIVEQIRDLIVEINEQGTAVLLVEQNANMALVDRHHGYIMETGKIVMDKPAAELLEDEDVQEFYLGLHEGERSPSATSSTTSAASGGCHDRSTCWPSSVPSPTPCRAPPRRARRSATADRRGRPPVLRRHRAIDGVSFEVRPGELFAIIGPNGAGKTSIFNCLSGVYRPQEGSSAFLGPRPHCSESPHHDRRAGHGPHVPEHRAVREPHRPRQPHARPAPAHRLRHVLAALFWTAGARSDELAATARVVEDIIDFLEIEAYRKSLVGLLPYGVQKRVELGRALAMEPKLLLLDEPVAGMNVEETEDMARFILDIRDELGIAMILVEHDMGLVMDIADRVLAVDFGQPLATGTPPEVQRNPDVIRAYLGEDHGHARPDPGGRHVSATLEAATSTAPPVPPGQRTIVTRVRDWAQRDARRASPCARRTSGIWQEITWAEYWDHVQTVAHAPARARRRARRPRRHPLREPPRVAVRRPRHRRVPGHHHGAVPDQPRRRGRPTCSADSGSRVLIAEDQEQVDKALEVADDLPDLERIVYIEPRGVGDYDDPRLISWDDFIEHGREHRAAHAGRARRAGRRGRARRHR